MEGVLLRQGLRGWTVLRIGFWSLTDFEDYSSGCAGRFGDIDASGIVGVGGDAEDFGGESDWAAVRVGGLLGFAGGFGEGCAGREC